MLGPRGGTSILSHHSLPRGGPCRYSIGIDMLFTNGRKRGDRPIDQVDGALKGTLRFSKAR